MRPVRVGSHGTPLARWQAERIRESLHTVGRATELVVVSTSLEFDAGSPLDQVAALPGFSTELDEALLEQRIDLAVHSLKDLPTTLPAGIVIAGVSERADPREALVGRGQLTWAGLPAGATLATSGLRRMAQLRRARPDLQVRELRGSIEARLAMLDQTPELHGIVLGVAGLTRLGLGGRIGDRLPLELLLPAPGQGALAVTVRQADDGLRATVHSAVNDQTAEIAVTAERQLLATVEAGPHAPVAAFAAVEEGEPRRARLSGRVLSVDGKEMAEGSVEGVIENLTQAAGLGIELAGRLRLQGAGRILAQARATRQSGPA